MKAKTEKSTQAQKILTAAFHCISTKGYAHVSLRDIADEAGVVLSQLNYYYKNKEGLFIEVIKVAIGKYLRKIEVNLQKGATIKEKLSFLTKDFQKMLSETPELFRLLYDFIGMSIWSDSFGKLLRQLFQEISDLIEETVLSNLSENDRFTGYSPKAVARMISGALFGIAIQSILDPETETLSDALKILPVMVE